MLLIFFNAIIVIQYLKLSLSHEGFLNTDYLSDRLPYQLIIFCGYYLRY